MITMGVQSKLKKCNTQCWITFLLWTLSIILVNMVTVNGAPKCPPGGTFSDKHTGRTECCDGICKHAQITGMEQECNVNCPNYKLEDILKAPPDTGAVVADSSGAANLPVILSVTAAVAIIAVLLVAVITKWKPLCRGSKASARPPQRVEDQHELQKVEEARERLMNDGQADQTQPQQIEGPGHVSVPEPQRVDEAGRAADVNRENDQSSVLVLPSGRQEAGQQYHPEQRPEGPHHEAQPFNYPILESGEDAGRRHIATFTC